MLERVRLGGIELRGGVITLHGCHLRERQGVAVHVAVDGRTGILLLAAAADALLHAVLPVALPVESALEAVGALPTLVLGIEVAIEVEHVVPVGIHEVTLVDGGGVPGAELVHLLHGAAFIAAVPRVEYLVQVLGVAQPAALMDVVADGARDEIILVGVGALHEELRHAVSRRGVLDVLAEGPPTVVEHLLKVLLRTLEQGDVRPHPLGSLSVGDCLDDVLVLHRVEVVHVVLEVVELQQGSLPVHVVRHRLEVGNAEGCLRLLGARIGHVLELVSPGVGCGEARACTRAELDALDAVYRSKEHPGHLLLAVVQRQDGAAVLHREVHADMVDLARLVVAHRPVTRSSLGTHDAFLRQVDARAGDPVLIKELNLQLARVVLVRHQVERDGQVLRGGNLALRHRCGKGVLVAQGEPRLAGFLFQRHRCPDVRIEVPHVEVRQFPVVGKVLIGV